MYSKGLNKSPRQKPSDQNLLIGDFNHRNDTIKSRKITLKEYKKLNITLSDISLLSTADKLIKMVEKKLEETKKQSLEDFSNL